MVATLRSRLTTLLTLGALLALPFVARAARETDPTARVWVTDNWARAITEDQGIVYVGGYFSVIAPYTGGGGVVDLDRGDLAMPTPVVDGFVFAVTPDGGGGWFIAGDFQKVGGFPRRNLAHVDGAGRVSNWTADVAGPVSCLLLDAGRLFVGGSFSSIAGVPRTGIAAVDPRTGAVLGWDARVEGQVIAFASQGRVLYLGGRFLAVGGEPRAHLAAVDASSASVLPWNPDASGEVYTLAVTSGTVFVGGESMTIGGVPRTGLAAVDARTGALLPWHPRLSATDLPSYVRTFAIRGSILYFAGYFDQVEDFPIKHAAAVNVQSGALIREWNPRPSEKVSAIEVRGDAVYLVGDFRVLAGAPRSFAGAVDAADSHLLPWDPEATGPALEIAIQANMAYVGGLFQGVGGRYRIGAAAIDAATSRITDWHVTDLPWWNASVDALAAGNGRVYAASSHNGVGGESILSWAFSSETGAWISEWVVASPEGDVTRMALRGQTLYLGGLFDRLFDRVSTVPVSRRGLAAVDATTSLLLPWDPSPYRDVRFPPTIDALVVRESDVYVGGIFTELGGAQRPLLGAVDAVTGESTSWVPASGHWGKAIAVTGARVFTGMPRNVSALDAGTGSELWDIEANGSVDALAADQGRLYVAGVFDAIDGQPRGGLAALDAGTGQVTSWDPGLNRYATGLVVTRGQLFGVGNFGVYSVPLSGTTPTRQGAVRSTPAALLTHSSPIVAGEARLSLAVPEPGPATIGVFDLQGRRIATLLDHAWLEAGTHEQSIRTSAWPRGLYFVRVDLAGRTETHRIAVIR